jgi:hypothetical protein
VQRHRQWAGVALTGVLMIVVAGCGGDEAAVETVTVTESVETTPATSGGGAAACRATVGELLQSEKDLWARLRVGVIYADYVKAVGDLAVADGRIGPISDPKCVEVRRELRRAVLYFKRATEGGGSVATTPVATGRSRTGRPSGRRPPRVSRRPSKCSLLWAE